MGLLSGEISLVSRSAGVMVKAESESSELSPSPACLAADRGNTSISHQTRWYCGSVCGVTYRATEDAFVVDIELVVHTVVVDVDLAHAL